MSRISDEELRQAVSLASPGPWKAEPMTGRGAWIAASDGNWAALSCGETDRLGEANARLIALAPALAAEVLQLREALQVTRRSILEGGGGGVTCTVWVPTDVCPSETLVDHIDAALSTKSPVVAKEDRDA